MNTYIFPESASTIASEIDLTYFALIAVSLFFIVVIGFAMIVFISVYRRRSPNQVGISEKEPQSLEIIWTVLPLFLGLGLFAWGANGFMKIKNLPPGAMEIAVVGKQWMWKFQHPDGRREINDLHVPVGTPIVLKLISQDVIHSFYVPAFRLKQDAVPMYYTRLWFEATKTGRFRIFCAEYCGKDHSIMGGWVHVMTAEEYEKWLASDPADQVAGRPPLMAEAEAGEAPRPEVTDATLEDAAGLFEKSMVPAANAPGLVKEGFQLFGSLTCVACHKAESSGVGPSLVGAYGGTTQLADGKSVKFDDNYIRTSVLNPTTHVKKGYGPVMPSFAGRVSEEDINALIAYIKYLKR